MKVGALTLALGLLLVLPSTTVLALTASLDRTMKAGTALLLLASLHSVSSEDPPPPVAPAKSAVDRCGDSMVCFAPESCKIVGTDHSLSMIKADALTSDCKAILKIRPYSAKMYRVVLESRDSSVTEISLTRTGNPLFSCKSESKAQYKGKDMKSIDPVPGNLHCEFIANDEQSEILEINSANVIEMSAVDGTSTPFTSTIDENILKPNLKPKYCDPVHAVYDSLSPGASSLSELTVGLTDLSCPAPYHIETRTFKSLKLEPEFIKTTSIACTKGEEAGAVYKFAIEREDGLVIDSLSEDKKPEAFFARCAVKTCSLCDHVPTGMSMVDAADGCKELKCASGRLKVGEAVGDTATCKKINDKPTWDLNGTPIEKTTAAQCAGLMKCSDASTICDASSGCSEDATGTPTCSSGELTLQSKQVTMSCNRETGKWMVADGGPETELPEGSTLVCRGSAGTAGQQSDTSTGQTSLILAIIFGVIILLALAVGFGIYFHRLRKARVEESKRVKTLKSMEKLKKQPGSKESKSANSNQSKSKEERKQPGTGPSTLPNKAPPPAGATPTVGTPGAPSPAATTPAAPAAATPAATVGTPGAPSPAATTPAIPAAATPAAAAAKNKNTPLTDDDENLRKANLIYGTKNPKPNEQHVEDEITNMHNRPAETTGTRDDTHGDANTQQMMGDTIQIESGQVKNRNVDRGRTNNDDTTGTKGKDDTEVFGPTMVAEQLTQGTGTTTGTKRKK